MKKAFYFSLLFAGFLLVSCADEKADTCNQSIELSFTVPDYNLQLNTRSTRAETVTPLADEKAIKNLYVFLFHATKSVITYNTGQASAVGEWFATDKMVRIKQNQGDVGLREVYVVANYDDALKTQLDAVTTLAHLQAALKTAAALPIAADIAGSGLLMEGHATHDFTTVYQLKTTPIKLTRAVAKLEITVTLNAAHQSAAAADYGYKFIDFGSETWVLEKADQQTTGNVLSHAQWQSMPGVVNGTTPATLSITTYINEYANTAEPTPTVEFKLPYKESEGSLPPPEFGEGDMYRLKLPATVTRNTCYRYNVEI